MQKVYFLFKKGVKMNAIQSLMRIGTFVLVMTGCAILITGAKRVPGSPLVLERSDIQKEGLKADPDRRMKGFGLQSRRSQDGIESENHPRFVPGEIIVMFKKGVNEKTISRLNSQLGTTILSTNPYLGFRRIRIPGDKTIEEMVELYNRDTHVQYAEPNAIARSFFTPNDPFFSFQWHFFNINMETAWDIQQGQSAVIVSILDTGVAYEDFTIPPSEVSEVISSDGMYHLAPDLSATVFVPGYDYIKNDTHPNDAHGHGTHVTGTVAQSTNNFMGVAGMAFGVSIMPVRVLGYNGFGSTSDIASGITYAKNNGANVINMSLGGAPGDSIGWTTVHLAMIDAWNSGVVICCATGNNNSSQISYPAGFDECIAVGSVRFDSSRAPYSNYGIGIDVVAPGGDIFVDQNGDGFADGVLQQTFAKPNNWGGGGELAEVDSFVYSFWQGTSMATPHVSALAALLISKGIAGADNIKSIIEVTAIDLDGPGYDIIYGYGLINPVDALNVVGVTEEETSSRKKPLRMSLFTNTPNPFNYTSIIRYELARPDFTTLKIYDLTGRLVRTLENEERTAGFHTILWDGEDDSRRALPSGVYFIKLKSGEESQTRRTILLR